jgi:hypothetical protein
LNQFGTIQLDEFNAVYSTFNALLEEALLYKDDVISKKSHEILNDHLSHLNTFITPLKKLELYLTVNEEELKLVLHNQFNQTL